MVKIEDMDLRSLKIVKLNKLRKIKRLEGVIEVLKEEISALEKAIEETEK